MANAERNRWGVLWGGYLSTAAALSMTLFSVGIRTRLRAATDSSLLGDVACAGGLTTAALVSTSAILPVAVAERGAIGGRVDGHVATFATDASNLIIGKAAPMSLAALTGAIVVAARGNALLPGWLTWAGAVITVGLASPVNFFFVLPGLAWTAVTGFFLAGND